MGPEWLLFFNVFGKLLELGCCFEVLASLVLFFFFLPISNVNLIYRLLLLICFLGPRFSLKGRQLRPSLGARGRCRRACSSYSVRPRLWIGSLYDSRTGETSCPHLHPEEYLGLIPPIFIQDLDLAFIIQFTGLLKKSLFSARRWKNLLK